MQVGEPLATNDRDSLKSVNLTLKLKGQPLPQHSARTPSLVIMPKGKRGYKFTEEELESLLMAVDEIVPVGNPEWEHIWEMHNSCYPNQDRTVESLKRKFQELAKKKCQQVILNAPLMLFLLIVFTGKLLRPLMAL